MNDINQNTEKAAPDATPLDQANAQANAPTNNPSTALGDSEKDAVSNSTTAKIVRPFGAHSPKQDDEPAREEPVIEGFIHTGLTIMEFYTGMISANEISPGVETFALTGQHVVTGTPLFNKFRTHPGDIRFLVDRGHWGKVFSHLPSGASESLTIDINPFIGEPMSLVEGDLTSVEANLAQDNRKLKMIFFDNLLDNLREWAKGKTKSALQHDILALHNAGVSNRIALVAIIDTNIPDQKTFLKDLKKVDFCPRMYKVTGTSGAVPTVNISAKGFSLDLHLDEGKWVEARVNLTKSEEEVLNILMSRRVGSRKSDIMNATDLLPSEVDSLIKSLKEKGKIVSIRKGTYAATTNG